MFYRPTEIRSFCNTDLKKKNNHYFVKLNVLRAVLPIIQVFWDITLYRLITIYQSTRSKHPKSLEYSNIILYVQKRKSGWCSKGRYSYKSLSEVSESENKMWERVYAPDLGYLSRFSCIKQPTVISRTHTL
jgi:hypothetical protein